MSFMIESEVSKQYLLEEDAVEGFRQAVNNGQIRLAMQILVDIIDVFEGIIASAVEDDEEEVSVQQKVADQPKEAKVQDAPEVAEVKEEVKEVVEEKKPSAKKAATKTEEATQVAAE